jgi:hypothetical protein
MSSLSRLFFSTRRRLYRRREALFLINFLFGLAILGVYRHQGPEEDILSRRIASLRPLFAAPAAPYFHLRRGLLFSCVRDARLLSNERCVPVLSPPTEDYWTGRLLMPRRST